MSDKPLEDQMDEHYSENHRDFLLVETCELFTSAAAELRSRAKRIKELEDRLDEHRHAGMERSLSQ